MKRLLPAAALVLAAACARGGAPPVAANLHDFTMTAVGPASESPFGLRDMRGRVWIVDFIYTRCGGPCPLLTGQMAELAKTLPPEVGLLTVTVDPDGDTPERLRAYAKAYGADARRWVFLRGTISDTYQLLYAGFHLTMSSDPKADPQTRVLHSTRFVLVDRAGAIRGYYDGLSALDNAALARDARRLLEAGT